MTTVDCDVSRHAVGRIALFLSPGCLLLQEQSELSKYREKHVHMFSCEILICFAISFC